MKLSDVLNPHDGALQAEYSHDMPVMGWFSTRWRVEDEHSWTTDRGVFSIDTYERITP